MQFFHIDWVQDISSESTPLDLTVLMTNLDSFHKRMFMMWKLLRRWRILTRGMHVPWVKGYILWHNWRCREDVVPISFTSSFLFAIHHCIRKIAKYWKMTRQNYFITIILLSRPRLLKDLLCLHFLHISRVHSMVSERCHAATLG